ncbi:unnamed protein product [Protopolystoma xenopodis]|uniref:Uncharacterized protein n=1 Tax=Protopolystoma xenopodis TaxID=117903 RepID=A0A448XQM0_9PLAT|nr:unnamed protein product [Protopolystoma xenopodis]
MNRTSEWIGKRQASLSIGDRKKHKWDKANKLAQQCNCTASATGTEPQSEYVNVTSALARLTHKLDTVRIASLCLF